MEGVMYAGGYAACTAMYAGGSGGAGDDAPCASLCSGGCGRRVLFAGGVLEVVEVQEVIGRVLLCMVEAVEGEQCFLEALEVLEMMRCVLLCVLEAVEGRFYLPEVCWKC